ncbi:hypothetical protein C8J57DRAFT_1703887 [Mycena rebaudengoi]|nr:hypothetical protein C8J57DRAFT_1703887 [Mycena rebaudengoi]
MSSTDPPPPPRNDAEYNVHWMDRTFRSRTACETLLLPEVQNGNLNAQDYARILAARPFIRFSGILGYALSGVGVYLSVRALRPPRLALAGASFVAAPVLGEALRVAGHLRLFRAVEDVDGFARAMDNVRRKVAYAGLGPITLKRRLRAVEGDERPFADAVEQGTTEYGESAAPPDGVPPRTVPNAPVRAAAGKSRWDEIRETRSRTEENKTWESIRRGRPRPSAANVDSSGGQPPSSEPLGYRDDDRAGEQARFDAMLEKERNMGASSSRDATRPLK